MKGMEEKLECWNVGIRESSVDCNDYLSYVKMGDIIYQVINNFIIHNTMFLVKIKVRK